MAGIKYFSGAMVVGVSDVRIAIDSQNVDRLRDLWEVGYVEVNKLKTIRSIDEKHTPLTWALRTKTTAEIMDFILLKSDLAIRDFWGVAAISLAMARYLEYVPKFLAVGLDFEFSLHNAVYRADITEIETLLAEGISIDLKNSSGDTPLNLAIRLKDLSLVEWICDHGADVNLEDNHQSVPLCVAAEVNSYDILKYLISKGAQDAPNCYSDTAVIWACKLGNLKAFKRLLKSGSKRTTDSIGNSCGHFISESGNIELMKYYGSCYPDLLWATNDCSATLLHSACEATHDSVEIAELLFLHDPNMLHAKTCFDDTPLGSAAASGNEKLTRYLAEKCSREELTHNLVGDACSGGNINIVRYFVEEIGLSPLEKPEHGLYPLFFASICDSDEVFHYLMQNYYKSSVENELLTEVLFAFIGHIQFSKFKRLVSAYSMNVNCVNSHGDHFLVYAAFSGLVGFCKYWIDNCFDPERASEFEQWILQAMEKSVDHFDVFEYFLQLFPEMFAKLSNGQHLVVWASRNGHLKLIKYLARTAPESFLLKDNLGYTPLLVSVAHTKVFQYLFKTVPETEKQITHAGENCWVLAVLQGSVKTVRFLVQNAPLSNSWVNSFNLPILAQIRGNYEILSILTDTLGKRYALGTFDKVLVDLTMNYLNHPQRPETVAVALLSAYIRSRSLNDELLLSMLTDSRPKILIKASELVGANQREPIIEAYLNLFKHESSQITMTALHYLPLVLCEFVLTPSIAEMFKFIVSSLVNFLKDPSSCIVAFTQVALKHLPVVFQKVLKTHHPTDIEANSQSVTTVNLHHLSLDLGCKIEFGYGERTIKTMKHFSVFVKKDRMFVYYTKPLNLPENLNEKIALYEGWLSGNLRGRGMFGHGGIGITKRDRLLFYAYLDVVNPDPRRLSLLMKNFLPAVQQWEVWMSAIRKGNLNAPHPIPVAESPDYDMFEECSLQNAKESLKILCQNRGLVGLEFDENLTCTIQRKNDIKTDVTYNKNAKVLCVSAQLQKSFESVSKTPQILEEIYVDLLKNNAICYEVIAIDKTTNSLVLHKTVNMYTIKTWLSDVLSAAKQSLRSWDNDISTKINGLNS